MSEAVETTTAAAREVAWHDLECGRYDADLPLWRELAREACGPILELGSGTGRVSLELARAGFEVTALDRSPALLAELSARARRAEVECEIVCADARELDLERRFALIAAPMQLVQLLDPRGRRAMVERAAGHLDAGGAIAIAILARDAVAAASAEASVPPLADVQEIDGWLYSSQPVDARAGDGAIEVRRLRQLVSPAGELTETIDEVRLDRVGAAELEAEAARCGLVARERIEIATTADHVGSTMIVAERRR